MALGLLMMGKPFGWVSKLTCKESLVNERIDYLSAFVDAIAAGHSDQFEQLVVGARRTGASREELLVAMRTGRSLAQVPASVITKAQAAIDAYYTRTDRQFSL